MALYDSLDPKSQYYRNPLYAASGNAFTNQYGKLTGVGKVFSTALPIVGQVGGSVLSAVTGIPGLGQVGGELGKLGVQGTLDLSTPGAGYTDAYNNAQASEAEGVGLSQIGDTIGGLLGSGATALASGLGGSGAAKPKTGAAAATGAAPAPFAVNATGGTSVLPPMPGMLPMAGLSGGMPTNSDSLFGKQSYSFAQGGPVKPRTFTYAYGGMTGAVEHPTDYKVYGPTDLKTEDLVMHDKRTGEYYGSMRMGEYILPQTKILAADHIMNSDDSDRRKKYALGAMLHEQLSAKPVSEKRGKTYAQGGTIGPIPKKLPFISSAKSTAQPNTTSVRPVAKTPFLTLPNKVNDNVFNAFVDDNSMNFRQIQAASALHSISGSPDIKYVGNKSLFKQPDGSGRDWFNPLTNTMNLADGTGFIAELSHAKQRKDRGLMGIAESPLEDIAGYIKGDPYGTLNTFENEAHDKIELNFNDIYDYLSDPKVKQENARVLRQKLGRRYAMGGPVTPNPYSENPYLNTTPANIPVPQYTIPQMQQPAPQPHLGFFSRLFNRANRVAYRGITDLQGQDMISNYKVNNGMATAFGSRPMVYVGQGPLLQHLGMGGSGITFATGGPAKPKEHPAVGHFREYNQHIIDRYEDDSRKIPISPAARATAARKFELVHRAKQNLSALNSGDIQYNEKTNTLYNPKTRREIALDGPNARIGYDPSTDNGVGRAGFERPTMFTDVNSVGVPDLSTPQKPGMTTAQVDASATRLGVPTSTQLTMPAGTQTPAPAPQKPSATQPATDQTARTRTSVATGGSGARASRSGSSPAAVSTPTTTPGAMPLVHTVQPGDTLDALARRYNTNRADLMLNNGLSDPNKIQAGQVLNLSDPRYNIKVPKPVASRATDERALAGIDASLDPNKDRVARLNATIAAGGKTPATDSAPKTGYKFDAGKLADGIGDIGRLGAGIALASKPVDTPTIPSRWMNYVGEVEQRKNQGLLPQELSSAKNAIANNYAQGVNSLGMLTGGGSAPGVTLAGLTNLGLQRGQQTQNLITQDALRRNANFNQYGAVEGQTAGMESAIQQDRIGRQAAAQGIGANLIGQTLQNRENRSIYDKSQPLYDALMQAQTNSLNESVETQKALRANAIKRSYALAA